MRIISDKEDNYYKIEFSYTVPFPLRVVEGSKGNSIILPFRENSITHMVNDKERIRLYEGHIQIDYPTFDKNVLGARYDTSGSTYTNKDEPILVMFNANNIKITCFVKSYCIDNCIDTDMPWLGNYNNIDRDRLRDERIPIEYGLDLEFIIDDYLHKLLTLVKIRADHCWLNRPMPEPRFENRVTWYGLNESKLGSSCKRMGGFGLERFGTNKPLNEKLWHEIGEDLKNNKMPEIYEILMSDARHMYALEDNRRAIIDLSTAYEAFCLNYFKKNKIKFKKNKNESFVDAVDCIMEKHVGKSWKKTFDKEYEQIRFLYEARNNIMHNGDGDDDDVVITLNEYDKKQNKFVKVKKTWKIHWALVDDGLSAVSKFIKWVNKQ